MKNTIQLALLFCLTAIISLTPAAHAEIIDPKVEDHQVTKEMLDTDNDDYDEGAVDLIGKSIYKYMQFGGDTSLLTAEQSTSDSPVLSLASANAKIQLISCLRMCSLFAQV